MGTRINIRFEGVSPLDDVIRELRRQGSEVVVVHVEAGSTITGPIPPDLHPFKVTPWGFFAYRKPPAKPSGPSNG